MNNYVSKVADTLISQLSSSSCSLEEIWDEKIPKEMKEKCTLVKKYIDDKVSLGNKYINY